MYSPARGTGLPKRTGTFRPAKWDLPANNLIGVLSDPIYPTRLTVALDHSFHEQTSLHPTQMEMFEAVLAHTDGLLEQV